MHETAKDGIIAKMKALNIGAKDFSYSQ
jgi:hypothetical protein